MQETVTKRSPGSAEPVEGSVTLCIRLQKYSLFGRWAWDMQSMAVFCSDVMDFPAGFEGTKGIIHPEDLANVTAALQVLLDGELTALDFRLITTYGEIKAISGQKITLENPDTSEEAAPEKELWEKELENLALRRETEYLQQRQILADATEKLYAIGSFAINKSTGEAWYSDGLYRIHGLPPQSLNHHANTFHAFLHPDDRLPFLDALEAAYAAEVPVHLEYRIHLTGDVVRTVRMVSYWAFNQKGQAIFTGVVRDLSEDATKDATVREAEAKLQLNQMVLKFAEQSWNTGYWFLDLVTRKITYSDNYFRIFGLKPQGVPAYNTFLNLVHPDDRLQVQSLIEAMYTEHQLPEIVFRIVRPDGRQRLLKQVGKLYNSSRLMMVGVVQDITVQRGLEKKITELTEKAALQEAIRQITEGLNNTSFVTWHTDGHTTWSEGFYRLLGLKPDAAEPSAGLLQKHVHPDDLKAFKDAEALVINGQAHNDLRFRILNRNGEQQLRISFHRLSTDSSDVVVGVVKDLTAEEAVQRKLVEEAQLAQTINAATSDILLLTDTDNTVLSWNRAAEEKTGIKATDALYNNLFDLFPSLLDEAYMGRLQTALSGAEVKELKVRGLYLRKAHSYHLTPIRAEGGEVVRLLHVVQDVSRELDLQQQLSERLAFIESLVEASVDRIVVLDKHMNYVYWNRKAEEYYVLAKEEVIGRNILEVFPGFRNDPSYGEFRRVLKGETVYLPPLLTEESAEYFETYLIPVKDDREAVSAILWIVHDLSNELQLQQVQRRAQQQLQEEHRRLREAQAIGHIGSFEWANATNVIHWSDEMYRIHGLAPQIEVMTPERLLSFVHPDDVARTREIITKARKEENTFTLTHRIIRADGVERVIRRQLQSFAGEDGNITHLSGTFQDITEGVAAQQQLEESMTLLRDTEAVAHTGSYQADLATMSFRFSDGMYRLFGEEPHSFVPTLDWIDSRSHTDDIAPVKEILDNAVASKEPYYYTRRIYRKDGVMRVMEVHGKVICNDAGIAVKLLGLVQDITERKQAEDKLKESRELLQTTIDSSLDMIQVFKAVRNEKNEIVDFRYILLNHEAEKWMPGAIGKSLLQLQPGVVEEGIFKVFKEVVETGVSRQYEKQYVHEQFNGWFYQSVVKLDDGVATTTTDITHRREAEAQVLRLKEAIAQQATDKYLTLFNSIDEAVVWLQMIKDESGKPVDCRLLELNPAYEKMSGGLRAADVIGKTAKEVLPSLEEFWIDTFSKVAYGGEALRFEHKVPELDTWYDVYASPVGDKTDGQFVAVWSSITERKKQEEKQAYLLRLSDATRTLAEPDEILQEALKTVAGYLDLDRVGYNEIDPAVTEYWYRACYAREGFAPVVGRFPMGPFQETVKNLQKGITFIANNAYDDSFSEKEKEVHRSLNVGAYVTVPLVKNGRWVCNLVAQYSQPRAWTEHEVAILEETAERIWAAVERAKAEEALRDSEARLQLAVNAAKLGTFVWHIIENRIEADAHTLAHFGWPPDSPIALPEALVKTLHPEDGPKYTAAIQAAADPAGPGTLSIEFRIRRLDGQERWMAVNATTVFEGIPRTAVRMHGVLADITERKQAEEALRQSEESFRLLVTATSNSVYKMSADWKLMYNLEGKDFLTDTSNAENSWLEKYIPEHERQRVEKAIAEAIEKKTVFELEHQIYDATGNIAWVYSRAIPKRNDKGEIIEWIGTGSNITQRKKA